MGKMNFFNTQSLTHPFPAELLIFLNPNPRNHWQWGGLGCAERWILLKPLY